MKKKEGENPLAAAYERRPGEAGSAAVTRLQIIISSSLHRREKKADRLLAEEKKKIVVIERAPSSALEFIKVNEERGVLSCKDSHILRDLVESHLACHPERGKKFLLTADKETLSERIMTRGREGENDIDISYVLSLDAKFRERAQLEGHRVIDTSHLSPEEVAHIIKDEVAPKKETC